MFFFPDLYKILAESTDYDKLLAVWKGWRDACRVMKPKYVEYISISNKAIRELGKLILLKLFGTWDIPINHA